MATGLLIVAALVAALCCPLMMLLGRRGIGPGCALTGCSRAEKDTLASLRTRQKQLEQQIERFEGSAETRDPIAR